LTRTASSNVRAALRTSSWIAVSASSSSWLVATLGRRREAAGDYRRKNGDIF
jgi:hypothetical protein